MGISHGIGLDHKQPNAVPDVAEYIKLKVTAAHYLGHEGGLSFTYETVLK